MTRYLIKYFFEYSTIKFNFNDISTATSYQGLYTTTKLTLDYKTYFLQYCTVRTCEKYKFT